jgi:3'(2'), 5'-bisphosphate nucleotidase
MLTEKQRAALLPDVEDLARRAGAAILGLYQSGTPVIVKADGSPVTAADLASDAILTPGLAALTPDIPVVSEEGVEAGRIPDISGGSFWLVDPLDGTREFIAESGHFTVLIGLVEAGRPVLGVMYGPVQDEIYAAALPDIAWQVTAGGRKAMRVRRPAEDGHLTVTTSYPKSSGKLERYLDSLPIGERIVTRSAFKFADVARGSADIYPGLGLSYEWDTAAGHALVAAAGGRVTMLDGAPLAYGKPGFKNPDILAVGGR